MFAKLRKSLRNVVGKVFFWIGWGLAILLIAQAIILSVVLGNPLAALLFGGIGVIVWVIAVELKYILTER